MKITIHIDGREPEIMYIDKGDEMTIQIDIDDKPIVGLVASPNTIAVGYWPDDEEWQLIGPVQR
jgi:hypothetical protein